MFWVCYVDAHIFLIRTITEENVTMKDEIRKKDCNNKFHCER